MHNLKGGHSGRNLGRVGGEDRYDQIILREIYKGQNHGIIKIK